MISHETINMIRSFETLTAPIPIVEIRTNETISGWSSNICMLPMRMRIASPRNRKTKNPPNISYLIKLGSYEFPVKGFLIARSIIAATNPAIPMPLEMSLFFSLPVIKVITAVPNTIPIGIIKFMNSCAKKIILYTSS